MASTTAKLFTVDDMGKVLYHYHCLLREEKMRRSYQEQISIAKITGVNCPMLHEVMCEKEFTMLGHIICIRKALLNGGCDIRLHPNSLQPEVNHHEAVQTTPPDTQTVLEAARAARTHGTRLTDFMDNTVGSSHAVDDLGAVTHTTAKIVPGKRTRGYAIGAKNNPRRLLREQVRDLLS